MAERINTLDSWQNELERLSLHDTISQQSSRHHLDQKDTFYPNYDSPVTLRYRDSVSSNASSSLSRNSTISSIDTRYFNPLETTPETNASVTWSDAPMAAPLTMASPNSFSPNDLQFMPAYHSLPRYASVIDPNGCFVPSKPLPFIQKSDMTKHHYVIPTFAMAGQSQAEIMALLFNHSDNQPFQPKEEYERTIPCHIDHNSSLITLSQYTSVGQDNPVSRNYLLGLGQRLGITTILVIVSIEVIGTVYPLLNNLVKAMEIDPHPNNRVQADHQPSWWSRVVLVINQQHGVSDHTAYAQRKAVLADEMPRIQERYRLSQPLSTLFVSTQVYDEIKNSIEGANYKLCSQRILWQMMERHMLTGRWCSESLSVQNRHDGNSNSMLNVLDGDDDSSSSDDDHIMLPTIIEYVDGKIKKPEKKKKNKLRKEAMLSPHKETNTTSSLQRRSTRRQTQKLHCYDGDDGSTLPLPVRHTS